MANPFQKRATEYLRDDEAFLAVVTPEPLVTFLEKPAKEERLYDRLAMIIGTPGSGKTTLARLFEYTTLRTLLRSRHLNGYRPLVDILRSCGAIREQHATLVGGRLPLEAEYREFWELPYPEEFRARLMMQLLQARAVLVWLRHIQDSGVALADVEIVPRADVHAAVAYVGGRAGPELLARARDVELAIYRISAALVPPNIEDIDQEATAAYQPFDVIEAFRIPDGDETVVLRPLIMFDDAHSLHPDQLTALRGWLVQRELKIARWVLTRLDALSSGDVLVDPAAGSDQSGIKPSREMTVICMQSGEDRANERRAFRKMAKDMAGRYLRQMDMFNRRGLDRLGDLLSTTPHTISAGKLRQLQKDVDDLQDGCGLSTGRRQELERQTNDYLATTGGDGDDVRLSILSVLFERYAKRVPQRSLFDDDIDDVEPRRPLMVDAGVADGARIHLLHKYDRPYYFGVDTLCDAGSENAEQFLQLAAELVSQSETQLIRRGNDPVLTSEVQHRMLRERAGQLIREWEFPQCDLVRRLADGIATECLVKSREGNAPLGGGANGVGIPQDEFDLIPTNNPGLARVIKFGVAYNAFALVPNHRTKNRTWCLIELGGLLLLHHGLTLKRGGFLERRVDDMVRLLHDG